MWHSMREKGSSICTPSYARDVSFKVQWGSPWPTLEDTFRRAGTLAPCFVVTNPPLHFPSFHQWDLHWGWANPSISQYAWKRGKRYTCLHRGYGMAASSKHTTANIRGGVTCPLNGVTALMHSRLLRSVPFSHGLTVNSKSAASGRQCC